MVSTSPYHPVAATNSVGANEAKSLGVIYEQAGESRKVENPGELYTFKYIPACQSSTVLLGNQNYKARENVHPKCVFKVPA